MVLEYIEQGVVAAANFVWGVPLLVLLLGGGLFLMIYSRLIPLFYFRHAVSIIRGKYDNPDEHGEISHLAALSSQLASTIGMGNIAGVAVAISMGGPGAIFWMWVSAVLGMLTKFFTCTLAVMYRGKDSNGKLQGGPMYVITEGMGKHWRPLAVFFSVCAALSATPLFQTNQLVQITKDVLLQPLDMVHDQVWIVNLSIGIVISIFAGIVVIGGIKRVAAVATNLVPLMVIVYMGCVIYILTIYSNEIVPSLWLILSDAFSGDAAMGGAVGSMILVGARRAAFSNEAGIGNAPMMHGAAKTDEPVREGLVAMTGPFIDTIVVCTLTALCLLVTDVWQTDGIGGIELTILAFEKAMGTTGPILLSVSVLTFSFTTIFSLGYYGEKSVSFVLGADKGRYFYVWYILSVLLGAVTSISGAISFIDFCFAMMAIPTMISTLYLAPKVMKEAKIYFAKYS
ncbi:MAG: alanine:cation symporter family protein [Reichenbachiella sp.]